MAAPDFVHTGSLPPWRVLVVENDPKQRADQVACLRGWGYEVFVAEAQSDVEDLHRSLLADALQKAREHHCHLALIDQRLESDVSRTDNSGVELAEALTKAFPPLHAIILSGYTRPASSVSPTTSWYFIGKETGPEALKNAIEAVLEQIRSVYYVSGV